VHEFCAKSGFAPKLLAYEEIPAKWHFVLMEHVEMVSITRMDRIEKDKQLRRILQSLRCKDFVHGDLRHTNVYWDQDQNRVILIDFDWSGTNRKKCYPSYMNPEVKWPKGASTGEVLSLEHDAFWVNQLLDLD
jgi:RIO-like serine/threonine protein kinase